MRILVALVVLSHVAFAAPATCPAGEKRFKCHQLALHAQLTGDLATARALYRDACDRGEAASCNNLAVLALLHPEEAVDPKPLFDKACDRLDVTACDNARRFAAHKDLSVALALGDTELTLGADAWHQLVAAACRAGDVFRCDDAASRKRLADLFADECRAGLRTACFDAASKTDDELAANLQLLAGCEKRDGRACHALATRRAAKGAPDGALLDLWKGACADKDWAGTPDDAALRTDDCARWAKATHRASDRRRAAELATDACAGCLNAAQLYDLAGDHAKAFALVETQCTEGGQTDACHALGERYVLGNGTRADIEKGLEQLGDTCPDDLPWTTCKRIGQWLVAQSRAADAGTAFDRYCKGGNREACYLQARAFEAAPHTGCPGLPGRAALAKTYDELCKQGDRAACGSRPRLCSRAMADYEKPRECSWGVGDGSVHRDLVDLDVVDLCPKSAWTPAVRKGMKAYDEECRQAGAFHASCDP